MTTPAFAPHPGAVSVAATASSVSSAITMQATSNALHIANTSATLYVTIAIGVGDAPTAVLGGDRITIPPLGALVIEANPATTHVAAIGSGAGPTAVVFTPGRVLA